MSYQQEKFTEIADAIREKTGTTDLIKPSEFASKVDDVFEAGKKSQYDEFWDSFQQNGTRTNYNAGFAGACWNSEIFKPKYLPVKPKAASRMFFSFDQGVRKAPLIIDETVVDFTDVTDLTCMFHDANVGVIKMNAIPPVTTKNMTDFVRMTNINTHNLTELKLGVHEAMTFNSYSFWSSKIEKVSFVEGSWIGNNIWFNHCKKLTHESLLNILNTLQKKTTGTFTCTLGVENLAKLTDTEKAIATEKGWTLA